MNQIILKKHEVIFRVYDRRKTRKKAGKNELGDFNPQSNSKMVGNS